MANDVVLRIKPVMESSDMISNISQIQSKLESLRMPKNLTDAAKSKFEELTRLVRDYQTLLNKPNKSSGDLKQLEQLSAQMKKIEAETEKMIRGFDFSKLKMSGLETPAIQKLKTDLDEVYQKIGQLSQAKFQTAGLVDGVGAATGQLKQLSDAIEATKSKKTQNLFKDLFEGINTGNIQQIINSVKELDSYLKPGAFKGVEEIRNLWKGLGDNINISQVIKSIAQDLTTTDSKFIQTAGDAKKLEEAIQAQVTARLEQMAVDAAKIGDGFNTASKAADRYRNSVNQAAHQQTEMQMQVATLQQQVKSYFGLDRIFRKIGQLAKTAMNTVKELDAAMTETAVVTNFSVSDMWNMLPTYTKNANALGSTISDVYNAATLYYQQGLTTNQSMDLANETLKMARIAGIEAAEATDMMTAALRGFNMEINQESAQRVNDVYSKLASITAANTQEIGTAMEKTASLASSAGMDFETTTAFLSQMIETTREAPENLGTAMKTIVARFQEMKEDPMSFADAEGEALNINRVDKALRSIGVSLLDGQNQFRKLDDVFIEISSRWDSLTQAQQRYIATTAAGSRQQSRFIAMMQDYDRTMELVDAAYAAEGAGQAQFEKTLDSMDSKLNKLKNAWSQFTMGLMNADFLKTGVDLITKFLDMVEKAITLVSQVGVIDPFKSIIKSALTATAVFGGLVAMSKVLMAGVGAFSNIVLGPDVAQKTTGLGGMGSNYLKRDPLFQQKIEQARQEAKARANAYNQAYTENLIKGQKSFEASRNAKGMVKANTFLTPENRINIGQNLAKEISKANFDQKGREAVQQWYSGAKETFEKTGNRKQFLNTLQKGFTYEGKTVKLSMPVDIDPKISQATSIAEGFDNISSKAVSAGNSIQSFALCLYGTPLQPFGMALNLVSKGFIAFGSLAGGVASVLHNLEQSAFAAALGQELLSDATALSALQAYADATGQSIDAAATELAGLAHEEGAVAAAAEAAGLDENTKANLVNAAAHAANAKASSMSAKAMAKAAAMKFTKFAAAHPVILAVGTALAVAAGAALLYYRYATRSERAMKKQGDVAAQASQDLATTKQVLEAVNNDLDQLAENDGSLDTLIKGTTEWNSKLMEANAHIIEMMGHYKTLNEIGSDGEYRYVKTDEDGRMSITNEGQEAIRREYQKAVDMATANNAIQGALYNNLKDLNSDEYKENERIKNNMAVNTDEYKIANLQNANIEKTNDTRLENAWKTGLHIALKDSNLGNMDAVENILVNQREKLVKDAANEIIPKSKKENKQEYADLLGYEYIKKDTYKDSQGNELEIKYDTVKEMLPELKAIDNVQEKEALKIQSGLTSAQEKYNKAVEENAKLNEEAAKTSKKGEDEEQGDYLRDVAGRETIITDILSNNADADLQAVRSFVQSQKGKESGLDLFLKQYEEANDENIQDLANLTGETVNTANYQTVLNNFGEQLRSSGNAMIQQQMDVVNGAVGILKNVKWNKESNQKNKTSLEGIQKTINSLEEDQLRSLAKTSEDMSDNFGDLAAQKYAKTVQKLADNGKERALDKFQNIFDSADFSSGLSTLEAFNKTLGMSSQEVNEFNDYLNTSGLKAQATANALQEVFQAEDFTEIEKELTEYINKQGHLDGTKILEVAESSATLKRYLEDTGASAVGLASAFELLNNGSIAFENLTATVVAALNVMDEFSTSVMRADEAIESFKIENDSGKYADAIKTQKEAIDKMIEEGEYGNEGLEQALTQAFGAKAWAKAYAGGEEGVKKLYNDYVKVAEVSGDEIASLYKDSYSAEDMLAKIQDHYKVSAEYADVLLQKAVNTNIELKQALEGNKNSEKMISTALITAGITNDKGKVQKEGTMASGELQTMALSYAGDDEKKQQEFLTQFAEQVGLTGKELKEATDFSKGNLDDWVANIAKASEHVANFDVDDDGETVRKELNKEWKAQGNEGGWWSSAKVEGKEGTYDLQQMVNQAMTSGATNYQAMEAARLIALKKLGEEGNNKTFEVGGVEFTKEDVENTEAFQAKYAEAIENAHWADIGDTIGDKIVDAITSIDWATLLKGPEGEGALEGEETPIFGEWQGLTMGWNNLNEQGLQNAYDTAVTNGATTPSAIAEAVGGYLSNYKEDFTSMSEESQTQAIQGMVDHMNQWEGFDGEKIAETINNALGTKFTSKDFEGEVGALTLDKEALEKQLEHLKASVEAEITTVTTSATGRNNPNSAFRRTGTMARGSRGGYTIPGRPTLTGEEGEELVWEPKRNEAYMVGSNGPQFANISKNAVVWNADQTKRIKRNSGSVGRVGTGARGITPFGTMAQAKGTDGAGGGKGSGGGMKIPGLFTIDATANIIELVPPAKIDPIPIKGKLELDKDGQGGILSKIKGLFGSKEKNTIGVTLKPTKILSPDKEKTIDVKGNLTEVKNDKVKTIKNINATARVKRVIKVGKVAGEPVTVNAKAKVKSADTRGAEEQIGALNDAANGSSTMSVDADTTVAQAKVVKLNNYIEGRVRTLKYTASGPDNVKVKITPDFQGKWERTLYISKKNRARGMNYQKYNSYAGGHGLVGPKGKGGMTLTGEEGYEVVWLPSQNKSMIVGAEGPQMVNLPPNAVVWPHEQSKKIMNNNRGVPVGSMKDGTKKKVPGVTKTEKGEVKFFNLLNLFDRLQAKVDKLEKKFEKASDAIDRYADSVANAGKITAEINKQLKSIKNTQSAAKKQENTALKLTKKINKSQKKIKISYDNGKSGKKNKSKEAKITEGKLVKRNKNGELVVNEKYIRKRAKSKGKNPYEVNQLLESMRSEAKSLIDTYNGNLETARDALEEAKEKQREVIDKIKEIYYSWENELTNLKNVQTKIDLADSFSSVASSMKTMIESQLKSGLAMGEKLVQDYGELSNREINDSLIAIENNKELLGVSAQNLVDDVRARESYYNWEKANNTLKKMSTSDKNYESQKALVETLREDYMAQKKGQQYITYTRNTDGTASVKINWEKLEADRVSTDPNKRITGTEYEAIKKYFETIVDDVKEMNNISADTYSKISSMYDMRVNTYSQMDNNAKTIAAGMKSQEEVTIKEFETLNNSIKSATDKLFNKVKKELDKQRKAEQNAETEKDLTKKMNRLAALRADTSGSNQVEIAKLEEEIRKTSNSYQDSLEDQLLERLQEDADIAAEQREEQISILQAQLEYSQSMGEYILKAQDLVERISDGTATDEEVETAKKFFMLGSDGNEVLTKWGEEVAEGAWNNAFTQIRTFADTIKDLDDKLKKLGESIPAINAITGQILQSDKEKYKQIVKDKGAVGLAKELKDKNTNAQGALDALEAAGVSRKESLKAVKQAGYSVEEVADSFYGNSRLNENDLYDAGYSYNEALKVYSADTLSNSSYKIKPMQQQMAALPAPSKTDVKGTMSISNKKEQAKIDYDNKILKAISNGSVGVDALTAIKDLANKAGYGARKYLTDLARSKLTWNDILPTVKKMKYSKARLAATWSSDEFKNAFDKVYGKGEYAKARKKKGTPYSFATGGLANYTGPAWLDGTPAKPELVLNAADTKNFLALRDILSDVMGSVNSSDNSYRSNDIFNININVDKIDNDYDVNRMVERVKKEITKSARYRNVTQARTFR